MNAHKCDRCGQYYDSYGMANNGKNFNAVLLINMDEDGKYYRHPPIELCLQCRDKVRDVLKPIEKKEGKE